MKVRSFSSKNSKNNVTASKTLKKDFAVDATILRKNGFVLTTKGFCRYDSKDSTIRAINDSYDINGSPVGTVIIQQDKTSYSFTLTAKESYLTISFDPNETGTQVNALTDDLISKYPTLEKYKGKLGYYVVSSEGFFVKNDSTVLSWNVNAADSLAFSKVISSANSVQFQSLYLMNSGKLLESISCKYSIA